jgi:hypothetical protein
MYTYHHHHHLQGLGQRPVPVQNFNFWTYESIWTFGRTPWTGTLLAHLKQVHNSENNCLALTYCRELQGSPNTSQSLFRRENLLCIGENRVADRTVTSAQKSRLLKKTHYELSKVFSLYKCRKENMFNRLKVNIKLLEVQANFNRLSFKIISAYCLWSC